MAGNIKGITVEIGGNTTGLDKALQGVNAQSRDLQKELREVQKQLDLDPTNVEMLAQKQELLGKAVEAAASKLKALRDVQEQVEQKFKNGEIGEEAYRAFQREVAAAEAALNKAETAVDDFNDKQNETVSATDKLKAAISLQEKQLATLRDRYADVVLSQGENSEAALSLKEKYITLNGTLDGNKQKLKEAATAIDKVTGETTEAATATDKLKTTIKEQEEQLDKLKRQYADVALTQGKGSDKANELKKQIESLDNELKENKQRLKEAEYACDNTGEEVDELSDEVEKSGKTADKAGDKFNGLKSVVATVGAVVAATVAAIGAAAVGAVNALTDMSREAAVYADDMATLSAQTGVSTDSLQAYNYAAELVDVSLDTLTGSMAKQIKSMTSAQQGTKNTIEAYEALGVSITDANGNMRDGEVVYWEVIDALGAVENETERDSLAMTLLGKSAQDLNPLIKTGSAALKDLTDEAYEAGAVMSKDTLDGLLAVSDNMERMNSSVAAAKNNVGTLAAGALSAYYGGATQIVQNFNKIVTAAANGDDISGALIQEFTDSITGTIEAVAAEIPTIINTVMLVLGAVISAIQEALPTLVQTLITYIPQILGAVASVLPLLLSALGEILIALVTSLTAALPELIKTVTTILLSIVGKIIELLPEIINAGIEIILAIAGGIGEALPTLIPAIINAVITIVQTLVDNIPLLLDTLLLIINGLINGIVEAIPLLLDAVIEAVVKIIDAIAGKLPDIIKAAFILVEGVIKAVLGKIPALVQMIGKIIPQLIKAILDAIPLIIKSVISIIAAIVAQLPEIINSLVQMIPQIIESVIVAVLDAIPLIIDAVFQLVFSIVQNLPTIILTIVQAIPDLIGGIIDAIMNCIPQIIEAGITLLVSLVQNMPDILRGIVKAIPQIVTSIIEAIIGSVGKIADAGRQLIEGLWNGIKDAGEWLWDKISGFFDGVLDKIKDFFGIASPSKLFRDEIGTYLAEGIGEGFTDEMDNVAEDMQDAIPTEFDTAINAAHTYTYAGEGTNTFDVTIPLSMDGKTITRVVSRIQYNQSVGRARVVGVSAT